MKNFFSLTGTTPHHSQRLLGQAIVGLTFFMLGASALVLLWAIALLR